MLIILGILGYFCMGVLTGFCYRHFFGEVSEETGFIGLLWPFFLSLAILVAPLLVFGKLTELAIKGMERMIDERFYK